MRRSLNTPIVLLAILLPMGSVASAGSLSLKKLAGKPIQPIQPTAGSTPLRPTTSTLTIRQVLQPANQPTRLRTKPFAQPTVSTRRLSGLGQLDQVLQPSDVPRLKPATMLSRGRKGAHR